MRVIAAKALDFVKRDQDTKEKELVLLFQWKSEAIDDAGGREGGRRK